MESPSPDGATPQSLEDGQQMTEARVSTPSGIPLATVSTTTPPTRPSTTQTLVNESESISDISQDSAPGETSSPARTKVLRRFPMSRPLVDKLLTPTKETISTMDGIFRWAVSRYAEKPCLASRYVLGVVKEQYRILDVAKTSATGEHVESVGERKEQATVGEWGYLTYSEVGQKVEYMARALRKLVTDGDGPGPMHMFARATYASFQAS